MEIPKRYNFKDVEEELYNEWERKGLFKSNPKSDKRPYTIFMPPPNITGIVHMGHVLDNTIQDILIRAKRMQGYEVLWQPGIDHAGIATQNVVEKKLSAEGKTRFEVGRDEFVKMVWKWREKYGDIILKQLRKLGVSCDWSRVKFTMDEDMSKAVFTAFKMLYDKGLIYKGKRIINWCPRCGTALSDDEVEYVEESSHLWYIKYPLTTDGQRFVVVATTRPETYLGDTAIAVHPEDERYKDIIGEEVILPLVDWDRDGVSPAIPVIADEAVDPKFGTGAVKVTPAHDPVDFEIGRRHKLPVITVLDEKGYINKNGGKFAGLERYEARKKIVKELTDAGYMDKIEDYNHSVGTCYRCHTVIEPYISNQWFVRMKPLAEPAIEAVRTNKIDIIPEFEKKIYFNWLTNVRDWCISRQIWWGHRIPVYVCADCGEMVVSQDKVEKCPSCGSTNVKQEEDVLDTWFSSWLWPMSTLGWPSDTEYLRKFYPSDVLVTGWDILFFWVARMIMAGLFFKGEEPFKKVYLHGIVRDEKHRKFSKSLGNSPDPLDLIDKYGADGVRISMMLLTPEGQDITFSRERMETGRNFANKIWNAARYILLNLEDTWIVNINKIIDSLTPADKWILSKLTHTVNDVTAKLDKFDFHGSAQILYNFFWKEFCDFYLETVKHRQDKEIAMSVATYTLLTFLKVLHPFMPFITEEIYKHLPIANKKTSIMIEDWPTPAFLFEKDEALWDTVVELVFKIRELRGEFNIPKKEWVYLLENDSEAYEVFKRDHGIQHLSLCKLSDEPLNNFKTVIFAGGKEFIIAIKNFDRIKEVERTQKEMQSITQLVNKMQTRLNNKEFLSKAPEEIVAKQRNKLADLTEKLKKLQLHLERIAENG